MRIINQNIMNQLFATTDEIPLDREAVQVPLAMEGEGRVARTAKGKIEITLPDAEDLGTAPGGAAGEGAGVGLKGDRPAGSGGGEHGVAGGTPRAASQTPLRWTGAGGGRRRTARRARKLRSSSGHAVCAAG